MSLQIDSRLNGGNDSWIRRHVDLIRELPEPGVEYRFKDIIEHPDKFQSVRDGLPAEFFYWMQKLNDAGVIDALRVEGESDQYTIYETNHRAWEVANAEYARKTTLPCKHARGFSTIDAERGIYECNYEYCTVPHDNEANRYNNQRFTRAEIEEAWK